MKLSAIYTNIHTTFSKDGNEGLITMDRFNSYLPSALYEFINNEAKASNVTLENGNERMMSLKVLKDIVVKATNVAVASGTFSLNSLTYEMLFWGTMWTTNTYNGMKRKITLKSHAEFMDMYSDMMGMSIDENPVAYLYNVYGASDYVQIYPSNITLVEFIYVRKPTNPFLDYYIDANYNRVFMDAGVPRTLTAGEEYRDGTTSGTKTSQTKELEIPASMHPAFQEYMIQKLSLILGDQYINQVAMAKQQLDESK